MARKVLCAASLLVLLLGWLIFSKALLLLFQVALRQLAMLRLVLAGLKCLKRDKPPAAVAARGAENETKLAETTQSAPVSAARAAASTGKRSSGSGARCLPGDFIPTASHGSSESSPVPCHAAVCFQQLTAEAASAAKSNEIACSLLLFTIVLAPVEYRVTVSLVLFFLFPALPPLLPLTRLLQ